MISNSPCELLTFIAKEMFISWTKATILQWNAFVPDTARRDCGQVIGSE
jgi:hypothetical protein